MARSFDPTSEEFTLEKIIEWGFDQYAEKVSEISGAATKELAIEISLKEINETWEKTELDMVIYKDKEKGHYKIRQVLFKTLLVTFLSFSWFSFPCLSV